MMSLLQSMISNPFMQMSALAALGASIAGGIVGSYVVAKRISLLSGSISHAVLGGIGLFVFLGSFIELPLISPLIGALLAGLLAAWAIGWTHLTQQRREDTLIAAVWTFGMALGVILISITPGYHVELMNYLFGNIVWTTTSDLWLLFSLDFLLILLAFWQHQRLLALCFDETHARISGQKASALYFLLLSMVAVTVVVLIQIVGSILVVALLCLPSAIAMRFSKKLHQVISLSVLLSLTLSMVGLLLSYLFNLPPGATIAMLTTIVYLLAQFC